MLMAKGFVGGKGEMADLIAVHRRELEHLKDELSSCIKEYPNFPKPGILFRDMMPICRNIGLFNELCAAIAHHARAELPVKIDAIAGLEARGFLLGPQVAMHLNVPFIPVRKNGKLPGPVLKATYAKEYGPDSIEIQVDAVRPGWKVLIVDDVLATGGTMKAAIELIRSAGGDVAEAFVLIELRALKGRSVIEDETPIFSLITYDD